MTSSAVPGTAAAASSQAASRLQITTTGTSTITSHHHHSPSCTRSPHSASSSPRGSSTAGAGGGGSGSTNQACAACKYQRRKCNPDCPLAPYFPADQQRRFLNAHRLFGVSNILKTLKRLKPELCPDAMGTLIYQSDMRAQDPAGGCYRLILNLERQLDMDTADLAAVLHHLALCRQAATAATTDDAAAAAGSSRHGRPRRHPLLLNAEQEVVDALYANHEAETAILQTDVVHPSDQGHSQQERGEQQQQQQLFDYFYYDATASDDASSKPTIDINLDNMQHFDFDDGCAAEKLDLTPVEPGEIGQQQHLDVNCPGDDHKDDYGIKAAESLVDAFDMRQELQPVVDVNAGIGADMKVVDVNVNVDVNVDLQEQDATDIAAGEAALMASRRTAGNFSAF
ncbi:hypothetical protein U9M48_039100 [Paspalum notatum var. saurae]|uniref:LOB domain-containing protein n=1 Tax=Paspalum notatum var. saurae TaxID=547442 RepID=A0AAQ3UIX4_PASNO